MILIISGVFVYEVVGANRFDNTTTTTTTTTT
eukprot:CAMPEP_0116569932 /NCGR_PEP_ID=MMETSP0397-20121206/16631_1 /TAXON_ID=216820 /ORGANISM="Cyclophora tenuis, Strain ECT3854" /LENGTH=31 /DNA_ID= /DNA_START= /DNA_END= /DNA_ORIENTATION=